MGHTRMRIAASAVLALSLLACEFRKDKLQDWDPNLVMGFSTLKARVFDSRCISCHSPSGGNKGSLDLTDYESAKRGAFAIEAEIGRGAMPPPPGTVLGAREVEWIRAWVEAGAPLEDRLRSDISPSKPTDGSDDSLYLQVRERIFVPECIRCHGPDKQKGDVRLDTYQFALQNIPGIQRTVLVDDEMPPRGSLPDEDKALLRAWIDSL